MEKNTSPFKQYTSIYLEDYTWPRTVPVKNKPFQPPVRTGVRLFCAEPDSRICKPQTSCYGDYKTPNITLKKIRKKSDSNLMRRHEILEYPPKNTYKTYMPDAERLKSTYQVEFMSEKLSYENLMDRANKEPENLVTAKVCKRVRKKYYDPLPFKKNVTKGPLLI